MYRLLLLSVLGIFVLGNANAQNIQIRGYDGSPLAVGQGALPRIQVQMNVTQRVTSDGVEEQRRVEESVRRSLYEMAMNECAIISSVFKTGGRLAALNVNSNAQQPNQNNYFVNGNANGTYELIPQP